MFRARRPDPARRRRWQAVTSWSRTGADGTHSHVVPWLHRFGRCFRARLSALLPRIAGKHRSDGALRADALCACQRRASRVSPPFLIASHQVPLVTIEAALAKDAGLCRAATTATRSMPMSRSACADELARCRARPASAARGARPGGGPVSAAQHCDVPARDPLLPGQADRAASHAR
jgi:hypothetical protein